MIISRTPMRISFAGGGSDLPVYYRDNGGAVLSSSIDKYVYLCLNKAFDQRIRIAYSRTEETLRVADLDHKLFRTVLTKLGIEGGVEIASIADIPSKGSGLGSSSAFTVGLLHAVHAYNGAYRSRAELAREACEVEIDICGEPIGKQDQYAAAMGGMNFIRFNPDETVEVEPVIVPRDTLLTVEGSMMMFYTGIVRSASSLLQAQSDNLANNTDTRRTTGRLVEMAHELRTELSSGNSDALGHVLHEGWALKKSLAGGISSTFLDDIYAAARGAGAVGGKLLGAGGGGFFLFYVPDDRQQAVKSALPTLSHIDFSLERQGSSIVLNS